MNKLLINGYNINSRNLQDLNSLLYSKDNQRLLQVAISSPVIVPNDPTSNDTEASEFSNLNINNTDVEVDGISTDNELNYSDLNTTLHEIKWEEGQEQSNQQMKLVQFPLPERLDQIQPHISQWILYT